MSAARRKKRYAVAGAGSWGTAVACVLAGRGHDVVMWGHDPENIKRIARSRVNKKYLPGHRLPDRLTVTTDPAELFDGADGIVSGIPTRYLRSIWTALEPYIENRAPIVSLTKGIENVTLERPSQILRTILPGHRVAVLSGPSHAEEVVRGMPTTVTLACTSIDAARELQADFSTKMFRVYTNRDVVGVEIGAAMKNVISIAAGIIDGLGMGDNTKAALLTRGLNEIVLLGSALGARRRTFGGMAGIGDLITTAFSPFGRNRAVGERIGKGEKLADILASTAMVAEGVGTTKSVHSLAKKVGVEMPITEQVYKVLFRDKDPQKAVVELMTRRRREE